VFVFGICCILSLNLNFFSMFSFFGKDFFTLLDKLTSNFLLPLGVIVCSIFVGFFMNKKQIYKIFSKFISRKIFLIWLFFIRFISPIAIILVMCYQIFV
ncbi:sodium-dependent transporter, partial [Campylobacter jejuni]|nr:sodium-dependent transporter [Campylobacter jejuni]